MILKGFSVLSLYTLELGKQDWTGRFAVMTLKRSLPKLYILCLFKAVDSLYDESIMMYIVPSCMPLFGELFECRYFPVGHLLILLLLLPLPLLYVCVCV